MPSDDSAYDWLPPCWRVGTRRRAVDREILRLAVPAFLALVAEPLFLLADAADRRPPRHRPARRPRHRRRRAADRGRAVRLPRLRHHRRASPASLGAGDLRGALAQGVDGRLARGRSSAPSPPSAASPLAAAAGRRLRRRRRRWPARATTYLRIAFLGTTPLLVMLAATGVLRGLQDTRTPLVVAVAGNAAQRRAQPAARLRPSGLGIAGSALGLGARPGRCRAAALVAVVVRAARRARRRRCARDRAGIRAAAARRRRARGAHPHAARRAAGHDVRRHAGAAAGAADVDLATHQLAMTLWTLPRLRARRDRDRRPGRSPDARWAPATSTAPARLTRRMVQLGRGSAASSPGCCWPRPRPLLGPLFTGDPAVRALLVPVLLVAALASRSPAWCSCSTACSSAPATAPTSPAAGLVMLAVYAPVALLVADAGRRAGRGLGRLRRASSWAPAGRAGPPRPRRRLAGHRRRAPVRRAAPDAS